MDLASIKKEILLQIRLSARPECKKDEYETRQEIIKHLFLMGKAQRNLEIKWIGAFKTVIMPPEYFDFDGDNPLIL